jgi:hypothetical protein
MYPKPMVISQALDASENCQKLQYLELAADDVIAYNIIG